MVVSRCYVNVNSMLINPKLKMQIADFRLEIAEMQEFDLTLAY